MHSNTIARIIDFQRGLEDSMINHPDHNTRKIYYAAYKTCNRILNNELTLKQATRVFYDLWRDTWGNNVQEKAFDVTCLFDCIYDLERETERIG